MSRNNKNSKRNAAAKEMSKIRLGGGSGPKATTPKHGKKKAWWQIFPSYEAYIKGGKSNKPKFGAAEVTAD